MNQKHLQLLLHLPKIKIPIPGHRDLIGKIVIDEIQVINDPLPVLNLLPEVNIITFQVITGIIRLIDLHQIIFRLIME